MHYTSLPVAACRCLSLRDSQWSAVVSAVSRLSAVFAHKGRFCFCWSVLSLLAFLCLSPPVAHASWTSTTTYNISGSGVVACSATGTCGGGGPPYSAGAASGTISINYTWQRANAGDDPPASVIVTATSSVGNNLNSGGGHSSVSGGAVAYQIKNSSGGSFTVTSPSMSASCTMGPSGGYYQCPFTFTVSKSDVTVSLSGVITDSGGRANILIGQGCTATLNGGTFVGYSWSVPGDIVGGFSAAPNPGVVSLDKSGGPLPLDVYFTTLSQPHWYWKTEQGSPLTVTCTADAFIGSLNIGRVTGTKKVGIWSPTTDIAYYMGQVGCDGVKLGLFPGLLTNGNGISFRGWAQTNCLGSPFPAGGFVCFAQLVTTLAITATGANGSAYHYSGNGQIGIDTGGLSDWRLGSLVGPDNGSWLSNGDTPSLQLSSGPNMVSITEDFAASTWFMYLPSGSDSIWVPLWRFDWNWKGTATRPNITSAWTLALGSRQNYSAKVYEPQYPTWTGLANVGGGGGWVAGP